MKTASLVFLLLLLLIASHSQVTGQVLGGADSFMLLDLPAGARQAALGGYNASLRTDDPTAFVQNPALLADTNSGWGALSYQRFFNQINHFNAAYNTKSKGTNLGFHIRSLNYGTFDGYDAGGNATTDFTASDLQLTAAAAKRQGNFVLGSSMKVVASQIAGYSSSWVGIDLGALYLHPKRQFTIGLTARNIGLALSSYSDQVRPTAPIDVMLGMSYKLEHAPLRLSLTARNLQQWNISYNDPANVQFSSLTGQTEREKVSFFDNFSRHFVVGAELLFSKNFQARIGYNHLINRDLKLENSSNGAGFSFGFMLRVKAIEFSYSRAIWSAAGANNYMTLGIDLDRILHSGKKN